MGLSITVNGFMTIPQYGQHVAVSGPSLFWFAIKASLREFGSFPASTCFSISWNCIRGFSMSCSFFCYVQVLASHSVCVCVLCSSLSAFASLCFVLVVTQGLQENQSNALASTDLHAEYKDLPKSSEDPSIYKYIYIYIYIILYIYMYTYVYNCI